MRWLSVLLPLSLLGADFNGTWLGTIPRRNGDPQDIAFKFAQVGNVLSGKIYGDYQSTPISEGKIAGDLITFIVNTQEQAGNQINESRVRFTGKITGDEIELVRERESSTNAGNGGGVQIRPGPKQILHLKRLP